ncbi:unnamed protein product [Gulo gulo]|uniref:Uncharacterized protein n=1 Tax=Gulo gulo TaxID=48420 RepID=A0A9X9Q0I5_GULGU|nr:unnamed protein product [Gulo gulo]
MCAVCPVPGEPRGRHVFGGCGATLGGGDGAREGNLEAPGVGYALSSGLSFPAGARAARPEPRTCTPISTPPGRRCARGTASARTASSCMGRASARCPPWTWPPATSALPWCCTRRSPRACALPSLTPRRPTASMRSPTSRRCPRSRHRCSSSTARRTK